MAGKHERDRTVDGREIDHVRAVADMDVDGRDWQTATLVEGATSEPGEPGEVGVSG